MLQMSAESAILGLRLMWGDKYLDKYLDDYCKGAAMADEKAKVKRLYVVMADDSCRLVNAVSGVAALRHVVKPVYTVVPARAIDVAQLMTAGAKVEEADEEAGEVEFAKQPGLVNSPGKKLA
jgi:hypothetical protein